MSTNISKKTSAKTLILMAFTLMLSGRAMTLAFIADAGSGAPGAPPAAWLMPLIGDAIIGLSALLAAYFSWRLPGKFALLFVVSWNVVGIWDALSAFTLHLTAPWPEFFMVKIFGASMFFMASAMHAVCIALALAISKGR